MGLTAEEFDRAVAKLKMTPRGKKHRFLWLEYEGEKILWTMRSQGRGDLGRVEFAIRKQLHVSSKQLRDLVNCPMTRDTYIQHLKDVGVIQANR